MKSYLRNLVAENKCDAALLALNEHYEVLQDDDGLDQVTLITNKLKRFQSEKIKGTEQTEVMDFRYNQITKSIVELISSIDAKDFEKAKLKANDLEQIISDNQPNEDWIEKQKNIVKWLRKNRVDLSSRITELVEKEHIEKGIFHKRKFHFEMVNVFLSLADAISRNNLEELDNPSKLFRHHINEKIACLKALELLELKIPNRFKQEERTELVKAITYLKVQISGY